MADLTITVGNVKPVASDVGAKQPVQGYAGAAITQGVPVYKDASDNNLWKPCDATSQAKAQCDGICLNSALTGQPADVLQNGKLLFGAILTKGVKYVVSANSGKICPRADLVSTNYIAELGDAEDTSTLVLRINNTNITVP